MRRIIERSMKCLPLKHFITMLPANPEVINISSLIWLLLFQVITYVDSLTT